MTDKRMALVPHEADSGMVLAATDRRSDPEEPMYRGIYRAMTSAAPNGGKVSRELFVAACLSAKQFAGVISQTRAVIEALGLEIEE